MERIFYLLTKNKRTHLYKKIAARGELEKKYVQRKQNSGRRKKERPQNVSTHKWNGIVERYEFQH